MQKWFKRIREDGYEGYISIIIPIVIHHGRRKWRHSLEFADLFHLPSEGFRQYVPKFEHLLHDIPHIDEEQFKTTTLLRIVQLIMKYIDHPEHTYKLPQIVGLLHQLQDKNKITEYLALILQYVLRTGGLTVQQAKDIVRELPHGEETVETTADVLRKEGVEIGRSEGEIKASQNNLITVAQAKFGTLPPEIIDQIRSIQTLETLQSLLTQAVIMNNAQEFIREVEGVSKQQ